MENTITMFFLVCYIIIVSIVMFLIRNRFRALTKRIVLYLLVLLPLCDSMASEAIYFAAREVNTSSSIYGTAVTSEFVIVGDPCNVWNLNTSSSMSFTNNKGFIVKIIPSYSLDKSSNSSMLDGVKKNLARKKDGVRYVVMSRSSKILNVTFRNKIVFDIKDDTVLGKSSDVSISRYLPFFSMLFNPSNRRISTFVESDFCGFEYSILFLDK